MRKTKPPNVTTVSVIGRTDAAQHLTTNLWKVSSGWHENYTTIQAKITRCLSTFWLQVRSLHQDWLPVPVVSM